MNNSQQSKPIVVLPSTLDRSRLSDGMDKTADAYSQKQVGRKEK